MDKEVARNSNFIRITRRISPAKEAAMMSVKGGFLMGVMSFIFLFAMSNAAKATVSFKSPEIYPTGKTPMAVAVGDFNGDGVPDLAVANAGNPQTGDAGSVSILLGNSDAT